MHAVAAPCSRRCRRSKAVTRMHITRRPYGRRARGTPLVRDKLPLICGIVWSNIGDAVSRLRVVRFARGSVTFFTTGVGMPEPPELFKARRGRGAGFYACLHFDNHAVQYQCFAMDLICCQLLVCPARLSLLKTKSRHRLLKLAPTNT